MSITDMGELVTLLVSSAYCPNIEASRTSDSNQLVMGYKYFKVAINLKCMGNSIIDMDISLILNSSICPCEDNERLSTSTGAKNASVPRPIKRKDLHLLYFYFNVTKIRGCIQRASPIVCNFIHRASDSFYVQLKHYWIIEKQIHLYAKANVCSRIHHLLKSTFHKGA